MNDLSSATGTTHDPRQFLDNDPPDHLAQRTGVRLAVRGPPRLVLAADQSRARIHVGLGVTWTRSSVRVQVTAWPASIPGKVRRHGIRRDRTGRALPRNQPRERPEDLRWIQVVRHPR